MSEGGNIIRIIGGKSTWTSEEDINIIATDGDVTFYSPKRVNIEGEQDGQKFGIYDFEEENTDENKKIVLSGWWSWDYDGEEFIIKDKNGDLRARLEDTVYFQVSTENLPLGTSIEFQLFDKDFFFDDEEFNDEKIVIKTTVSTLDSNNKGKIIPLKLYLPSSWYKMIKEDELTNNTGQIEIYWKFNLDDSWQSFECDGDLLLDVYHSNRNLFLKPAAPNYNLPEVIDGNTGDFIVFLSEESGDVVGDFDSTIKHFYAVKVKIMTEYKSLQDSNEMMKTIHKRTYNLDTGLSTHQSFTEIEKTEIMIKGGDYEEVFLESAELKKVKKQMADYYNIYDIGNGGLKVSQKALNVLGFLDYMTDSHSTLTGLSGDSDKPSTSDIAGTLTQHVKLGRVGSATLFGLIVFEETIVKDAIRDIDEFKQEYGEIEWQNTKRKGLKEINNFLRGDLAKENLKLFSFDEVTQSVLDKVLARKIHSLEELDDANFNSKGEVSFSANSLLYSLIFREVKNPNKLNSDFILETIIIQ